METLLDFTFEHAGSLRFVKPGDFEDLGRVEPAVCASSHYRNTVDDPAAEGEPRVRQERTTRGLTFRRREHHCMWPRSGSPQTVPDRASHRSLTLNICTGAIAGRESNKTGYLATQTIPWNSQTVLFDVCHSSSLLYVGLTMTTQQAGQLGSDSGHTHRDRDRCLLLLQKVPCGYEQSGTEIAQITRNKDKISRCVYGLKVCDKNGNAKQS